MDELLEIVAWVESLSFSPERNSGWDNEEEQIQWADARDSPGFDSQWMRILALVQMQEEGDPPSEAEHNLLTRIRQVGFTKICRWALANELAGYAADDFDLIARAARVGLTDFWLDKLRHEYEEGRFPHGTL